MSASDGTAVLPSGGSQCFLHGVQCTSSEERESRIHPIETAPFCPASVTLGEKANGRSRQKAKADESAIFWTNVVLSLVKQLWDGRLNDELIQAPTGLAKWSQVKDGADSVHITNRPKEKIKGVMDTRPDGFPR